MWRQRQFLDEGNFLDTIFVMTQFWWWLDTIFSLTSLEQSDPTWFKSQNRGIRFFYWCQVLNDVDDCRYNFRAQIRARWYNFLVSIDKAEWYNFRGDLMQTGSDYWAVLFRSQLVLTRLTQHFCDVAQFERRGAFFLQDSVDSGSRTGLQLACFSYKLQIQQADATWHNFTAWIGFSVQQSAFPANRWAKFGRKTVL